MVANPPAGFPQITPFLLYNDVDAAADWLIDACGFVEQMRMKGPDGPSLHIEIRLGDGVVMMGCPGPDYQNPRTRGGVTQLVFVYVDDVDAHHAAAVSKGAKVTRPLEDQFYGDRTYSIQDAEGHEWTFAQHVRDVAPEDMKPT